MAFDRSKGNCSLCYPERCTCDARTYALEKEASRWTKAAGVTLPLDTTARFLGGNHERTDRGDPQEHLARAHRGRRESMELRHYLEILVTRLEAMRNAENVASTERPKLDLHARVLAMHLEGKSLLEISEALGRRSHSYASELLTEIRAEAGARFSQRGSVAVPCKCGRPGCIVMTFAGTGRPRQYATKQCAGLARWRRWRLRRRRFR